MLDSVLGAERLARAGPHPFGTCGHRNKRGKLADESAARDGVRQGTRPRHDDEAKSDEASFELTVFGRLIVSCC
jgi:hypothetical protein